MIKKILGFDVSSTTIGICSLEWDDQTNDIKFLDCSYYKPNKNGNIVDRIKETRDYIKDIIENVKPDYIGIEDIIKFMKGKSTASTIIMLTTFNRMICLMANDYLGRAPELFNVMSIRHGLKFNKVFPKKEEMPELVAKHLGITFPYVYKKSGVVADESCDMADGIAVALYYARGLAGKIKIKSATTEKKKKAKKTVKIKKVKKNP